MMFINTIDAKYTPLEVDSLGTGQEVDLLATLLDGTCGAAAPFGIFGHFLG